MFEKLLVKYSRYSVGEDKCSKWVRVMVSRYRSFLCAKSPRLGNREPWDLPRTQVTTPGYLRFPKTCDNAKLLS